MLTSLQTGQKKHPLYLQPAAAAKSLQSCLTLCDPIDGSPPGSPVPGILQARTRVGCHFLLQCRKVKSEREVAQSCPTLCDPMDCSLPGFSVHGIFQARVLEWGAITLSIISYKMKFHITVFSQLLFSAYLTFPFHSSLSFSAPCYVLFVISCTHTDTHTLHTAL